MKFLAIFWSTHQYLSLLLLASILLITGCNQPLALNESSEQAVSQSTFELPTAVPTAPPTPINTRVISIDSLTPAPTTITPIPDEVDGWVVGVLDGDTIGVVLDGDSPNQTYQVRYIGIDAPPNIFNDPWGVVSYETNSRLVGLKIVRLVRDARDFDDEGNLLRHVYVNNQLISILLTEQGLAQAATGEENTQFEAEILEAENRAQEAKLGIWAGSPPTPTATRTPRGGTTEDEPTSEADETGSEGTAEATGEATAETTTTTPPSNPTTNSTAATETPKPETTETSDPNPNGTTAPTVEGTEDADN